MTGLPPDCALKRAVDPNWQWSTTNELLACLVEVTDRNGIWFFQANSKKGTKNPPPVHIPRPWESVEDESPQVASTDEMKAFFGRARR